jgi:hypothetical protein
MDPQGGAALAGAVEVALEGGGVVGEATHDPPGEAALGEVPLVFGQDLLAGVDPQVAIGESSRLQRRPGLLGVVVVLQDGDQESLGVEHQGPVGQRRVVVAQAHGPDNLGLLQGDHLLGVWSRPACSAIPQLARLTRAIVVGGPGWVRLGGSVRRYRALLQSFRASSYPSLYPRRAPAVDRSVGSYSKEVRRIRLSAMMLGVWFGRWLTQRGTGRQADGLKVEDPAAKR